MIMSPGIVRHFKGNLYFVSDCGKHTETGEILVVYYPLYPSAQAGGIWIRPHSMMFEEVERDEYKGPRFTKIMGWGSSVKLYYGQIFVRRGLFRRRQYRLFEVCEDKTTNVLTCTLQTGYNDHVKIPLADLLGEFRPIDG